jgi:hypothetical protein
MHDDMGVFRADIDIENPARPGERRALRSVLGSRTLEGLNFRIEPVTKQLVDAGPAPAAVLS